MDADSLMFFEGHPGALPLYMRFEERLRAAIPEAAVKAQKTQLSFYNRHMFACVSFAAVRKRKDRPENYIVVTFGLGYRLDSPRVDAAVEPYPGRWTHHVLISGEDEIDDELIGWIVQAADFAGAKR